LEKKIWKTTNAGHAEDKKKHNTITQRKKTKGREINTSKKSWEYPGSTQMAGGETLQRAIGGGVAN